MEDYQFVCHTMYVHDDKKMQFVNRHAYMHIEKPTYALIQ